MNIKLLLAVFVSVCFISAATLTAQQEKQARDKYTLLTMPYNQRPLTLYKGQLQINAGYRLAVRTKTYDENGNRISLKEDGSASIIHTCPVEIKYGIADFLEIGAGSYYLRNGIRSETSSTLSGAGMITANTLNEYRGFGDLSFAAALRLPLEYKSWDLSLRGGIILPLAEHKPSQPTHSITDYTSPNTYNVNYQFNNNNGNGVPIYFVSTAAKVTFSKFSLEAGGCYRFPAKEGESIRWGWTLYGSTFSYYNNPYNYLTDRSLTINGSTHYQAAGWFDIFVTSYYFKSSSGWTEYFENKYANPEASLFTIEPGFELQISPSLTIYQYAGFQLAGTNSDAPFYLLTTISFNSFPFWK